MKMNVCSIKRIIIAIGAFMAFASQSEAQKFIDVYQNGNVAWSFCSSDIDSVNITGVNSSRQLNFWRAGNLSNCFYVNAIDSVKVYHAENEPLAYLGILGFNQAIYSQPIDILASSTSSFYNTFVSNLTCEDGKLLYYGVERALDMLTQYKFTAPLSSVNLITFTDGLDQGSLMMNDKYLNDNEYLSNLKQRISKTSIRGIPLTAYCIGLHGDDVANYSLFQSNLHQLASSGENAIEVNTMSDVQSRLQEIADQIINICSHQTVSMRIPGQNNDTRVCFTFDGKSPKYSSIYIDGVFNSSDRSLRNLTYHGIRSTSGSTVGGVQDGIFVSYTFSDLQRTDGNGLIPIDNISLYNLANGSTTWQIDSNFTSGNNTQTTVSHSGAAVMLVLDCSNSLGSQFANMQSYAKDFINRVANNSANFTISAPVNVMALMDDKMNVKVSWDAVNYAEYYDVFCSQSQNSDFIKIAENITATSWIDESPLTGTCYYRISAKGHGLASAESDPAEVFESVGSGSIIDNYWFENGDDPWPVDIYQSMVNPCKFRIMYPFGKNEIIYGGGDGSQSKFMAINVMHPGDTLAGQNITVDDLVYFSSTSTGSKHPYYNATVWIHHPARFSSMSTQDCWLHNRVIEYQENGLPGRIQLAPFYFMDGIGGWDYTQYDGIVFIDFPRLRHHIKNKR